MKKILLVVLLLIGNISVFAESSTSIDAWIIFSNANNKYDSVEVDAVYIPLDDDISSPKRYIGYSGFFLLPQNTEIHIPPKEGYYFFVYQILGFSNGKSVTDTIRFTGCNNFMQIMLNQSISSFILYLSQKDNVYAQCQVSPSPQIP